MGYVEETGAAQFLRDVRIASIYEGTTGIQSNDLVGRKLGRDRGAAMAALAGDLLAELEASRVQGAAARSARDAAIESIATLREATEALLRMHAANPALALAVAVPYLKLCGVVIAGCLMARAAAIADAAGDGDAFYQSKLVTCRFYAAQVLPEALGLARVVKGGADSVSEAVADLL
jgi:hypothetical protein